MPGLPSSFHTSQLLWPQSSRPLVWTVALSSPTWAAYPKEDTDKDPLDDGMDIKNVFKKAGFETQQRVRMLLSQPPSIESTLRVGDWHADRRLMHRAPNGLAARGEIKTTPGKLLADEQRVGPDYPGRSAISSPHAVGNHGASVTRSTAT